MTENIKDCVTCEHGDDSSGYCLDCYAGGKYTQKAETGQKAKPEGITKAKLKEYKHLRQERDKLARMLDELEATLFGPKAVKYDAMPRGGSGPSDPVAEMAGKHIALREDYARTVAKLTEQMAEIERAIAPLEPRERTIIRLHYFQGLTWEQVAVETNYTWRHVHRIHGAAIEKLQGKKPKK